MSAAVQCGLPGKISLIKVQKPIVDDFVLFAFEWMKARGMFAGLKRSRVGLIYCL